VLAYGVFALQDAGIKWLVAEVPVWQVLFFRSTTIVVVCLAVGRRALLERAVASPLKRSLTFRGVINLIAWLCYYTAARTLPLAQLLCLYFAAPLMITIMARQILKEKVTGARWLAVVVGFIGVLFASDPFGVTASLSTLLVLIAAALWGYSVILMRQIARREPSSLQVLSINIVFMVSTGTACLVHWHPITPRQVPLLIGVGLLGGLAQFLTFEAARMIPASVMATVEYSALPWAFLLGYWIWLDIPVYSVFIGAALIALAGFILVYAERRA
jgi:drug/metabolite transporter (DMT)-like permease